MPVAYVNSERYLRFYKHENTLKAILRKIRKQNYPKGTELVIPNWFAGYADLVIYI